MDFLKDFPMPPPSPPSPRPLLPCSAHRWPSRRGGPRWPRPAAAGPAVAKGGNVRRNGWKTWWFHRILVEITGFQLGFCRIFVGFHQEKIMNTGGATLNKTNGGFNLIQQIWCVWTAKIDRTADDFTSKDDGLHFSQPLNTLKIVDDSWVLSSKHENTYFIIASLDRFQPTKTWVMRTIDISCRHVQQYPKFLLKNGGHCINA